MFIFSFQNKSMFLRPNAAVFCMEYQRMDDNNNNHDCGCEVCVTIARCSERIKSLPCATDVLNNISHLVTQSYSYTIQNKNGARILFILRLLFPFYLLSAMIFFFSLPLSLHFICIINILLKRTVEVFMHAKAVA